MREPEANMPLDVPSREQQPPLDPRRIAEECTSWLLHNPVYLAALTELVTEAVIESGGTRPVGAVKERMSNRISAVGWALLAERWRSA